MLNKSKKILDKMGPYVDEGLILVTPNFELEILSDAAYKFLEIKQKSKKLHIFDLPENALSKKIEEMVTSDSEIGSINSGETHTLIELINLERSSVRLLIIKDDSKHEKMLNMGKEFVGNASHELRTPITIIKGFTEMLLEAGEDIEPVTQKSILKKMQASCDRMEHLVKHLLRLTDLENCDLEALASVDIHRLIEDISYQVVSIYPDFRIEHLRTEDEAKAYIDSDLIELVLTNLFKNSVKYSRDEKVIEVKVDTTGEYVYIQISDKGIGIPDKDLDKIFDRFYTVDKAHCRKLGGAGLGLSIVKLIIEKHGGKIFATSEFGQGTTMHLYLPKAKEPMQVALK
ncbi:MAG: Sensor histidine kinase WalK [Chlamydiia bacterium]|nr:Sensor histidine kinase WalK [Chlamydiia bacterium]